jgi:hypothetical protein
MDGPPARGGFASTTSVDDDWRGVGDNRKDNQTVDEENERGGEDAEMLDEDDGDDDEDDASDVRFMDRGVWEASTLRHADGTFGFQSFQSLIFARAVGCLLKSRIATRRFPARRDEETDEETNERGAVSRDPFLLFSTDDQCWICLDGDTAGREVRTRCDANDRRRRPRRRANPTGRNRTEGDPR